MKKLIITTFILIQVSIGFAQSSSNSYEVEILMNPNKGGKDTREVNSVLTFEKDSLKIVSRRKNKVFKEFNYSDIRSVEHSYSKDPFFSVAAKATIMMLLTGLPIFYSQNEKHWITVLSENDFAVLKVENDNYRMLRNEFFIKKLALEDVNENFR
jgi:hypothetical protein